MHLRDRGGGDRYVVESRKQLFQRTAEFGRDQRARLRRRKRRQPVLQQSEIGGDLVTEQICSCRQHLAELDKGRPDLLERRGEALARPPDDAAPAEQAGEPQQWHRPRQRLEQEQRVMARQRQRDADEARDVAGAAKKPEHRPAQSRQAECNAATPPVRLRNRARSRPAASIRSQSAACDGKRRMLSAR